MAPTRSLKCNNNDNCIHNTLQVPSAVANFPKELFSSPKAWAASSYNLKQWSHFPSGGHFAALEEPNLLAHDVQKFFAEYH